MENVLVSLPEKLATRMREVLPRGERSQTIAQLLAREIKKREKQLIQAAQAVEKDEPLQKDMQAWEVALNDGLDNESW